MLNTPLTYRIYEFLVGSAAAVRLAGLTFDGPSTAIAPKGHQHRPVEPTFVLVEASFGREDSNALITLVKLGSTGRLCGRSGGRHCLLWQGDRRRRNKIVRQTFVLLEPDFRRKRSTTLITFVERRRSVLFCDVVALVLCRRFGARLFFLWRRNKVV